MSYQLSFHSSVADIPVHHWDDMREYLPISMARDYLALIERLHQNQFDIHYAIVTRGDRTVGMLYFQIVKFKGAYVKNFFRTDENTGFIKKLFYNVMDVFFELMNWNLLLAGNIFFTGEGGVYFDSTVKDEEAVDLIHQCYEAITRKTSKTIHGYMMNNVYNNDFPYVHNYLKKFRYGAYPVDPDMFMDFKSDWNNYDNYLADLTSKYRVRLKKVLKNSATVDSRLMSAEEIQKQQERIHELYLCTAAKVDLNLGYLDKDYFGDMNKLFGDKFQLIGYYNGDELIGFMSLLRIHDDIDVNYMGMNYDNNKKFNLYNRMLADLVKLGIQLNAKTMHLGRTATEIKSTIGAEAKDMMIYLSSPNSLYARGIRYFQSYFGSPQYTLRHPFKK